MDPKADEELRKIFVDEAKSQLGWDEPRDEDDWVAFYRGMFLGLGGRKPLSEAVNMALGAASMCWDPPPGDQIFDSTRCAAIGTALTEAIMSWVKNDMGGTGVNEEPKTH